jgi:hypothetical protein
VIVCRPMEKKHKLEVDQVPASTQGLAETIATDNVTDWPALAAWLPEGNMRVRRYAHLQLKSPGPATARALWSVFSLVAVAASAVARSVPS